jgi:hypothetical protein
MVPKAEQQNTAKQQSSKAKQNMHKQQKQQRGRACSMAAQ